MNVVLQYSNLKTINIFGKNHTKITHDIVLPATPSCNAVCNVKQELSEGHNVVYIHTH